MKTHRLLCGLVGILLTGCAADPSPAPVAPTDARLEDVAADLDAGEPVALDIDPRIAEACDLPTAYFAFDSAKVGAGAREALDALAECFDTGPLAGKRLKLVGHADPRGEVHYNFALGQRRADSVKNHLVLRGLDDEGIETSSVGESEATGHDEETWARDRRVEVLLDG